MFARMATVRRNGGGTGVSAPFTSREKAVAVCYGVACHALFVCAVGAMIAEMFFGMSRALGALPPPFGLVADAALVVQFPLIHSWLLTPRGSALLKKLAPRAIAGRLATTTYVAVASIQTLLLFTLWSPSGTVWWEAEGGWLRGLALLYAASWLLLGRAIYDAGLSVQAGWLGWRSVVASEPPRFPPMPVGGLFRLTRQPIYVAFAMTLWTVPTWTPDQLAISLVLTAYCIAAPRLKERRFRRRFGPAFDDYARRVPFWLPWPRPRAAEAPGPSRR